MRDANELASRDTSGSGNQAMKHRVPRGEIPGTLHGKQTVGSWLVSFEGVMERDYSDGQCKASVALASGRAPCDSLITYKCPSEGGEPRAGSELLDGSLVIMLPPCSGGLRSDQVSDGKQRELWTAIGRRQLRLPVKAGVVVQGSLTRLPIP